MRKWLVDLEPDCEICRLLPLKSAWYTAVVQTTRVVATVPNLFFAIGIHDLTTFETRILKGAAPAKLLRETISSSKDLYIQQRGQGAVLATVIVGRDAAALSYRSSIERTFKRVEIEHRKVELDESITNKELSETLAKLNAQDDITGILMLMPLPDHLDPHVVLETLSPLKDVDGITPVNSGRLHLGLPSLRPSTPAGGMEILRYYGVDLAGANVVVVGRSNVVGRPLATMLTHANATVTLLHTKSRNLAQHVRRAEIVCVAAGSPGLITGKMIRKGALVLDFGVNVTDDNKVVGDADFESLQGIASAITPTPGGTGPVTAMVLARNVLAAGFAHLEGTLDALQELDSMLQCPLPDNSEFLTRPAFEDEQPLGIQ